MTDDKKTIKFQMMMSPAEAEALDDWGFSNRIRSRAEAIRRLMQVALLVDEKSRDLRTMLADSLDRFAAVQTEMADYLSTKDEKLLMRVTTATIQFMEHMMPAMNIAAQINQTSVAARNPSKDWLEKLEADRDSFILLEPILEKIREASNDLSAQYPDMKMRPRKKKSLPEATGNDDKPAKNKKAGPARSKTGPS